MASCRRLLVTMLFAGILNGCFEEAAMSTMRKIEWPTMAIDGTPERLEPPRLAQLHALRRKLGDKVFLPKNKEEVDMLYRAYKAGAFSPSSDNIDQPSWENVEITVNLELGARIRSGDMFFIDKYLGYLETFLSLVANHPDKSFATDKDLFRNFGILDEFIKAARYANGAVKRGVISQEQALYIVTRLDKMLKDTKKYGSYSLLNTYGRILHEEDFLKSEAGKAMTEALGKMILGEGFYLTGGPEEKQEDSH